MPRKEKRLMNWLVNGLNTNEYEGMSWISRNKKELGIPWPRQKSKSWNESDSEVILGYIAMQKGYKNGDDKDYVKWKARFRTALNKEKALKFVRFDKEKVLKTYRIVSDYDCDYRYLKPCSQPVETNAASPCSSTDTGYDSAPETEITGITDLCERDFELIALTSTQEFDDAISNILNGMSSFSSVPEGINDGIEMTISEEISSVDENYLLDNTINPLEILSPADFSTSLD